MCSELLRRGDRTSIVNNFILINVFYAVGRAGEAARSAWTEAYWDDELEVPVFLWNSIKTSRQEYMPFVADFECAELCFLHALSLYLIFGGSQGDETWIFPDLAKLEAGGAAKRVTSIVRKTLEFIPKYKSVAPTFRGTSVRGGAANIIVNHQTTGLIYGIFRGGWSIQNNIQEYLPLDVPNLLVGALALAGCVNTRAAYKSPRLDKIKDGMNDDER